MSSSRYAPSLTITGLTRRFGAVTANDSIDLSVEPGSVVGLLGHNGAGKTTLVSQVVGLLRPDAGDIRVGSLDAIAHPAAARRAVALQPQAQSPIDGLTPRDAVEIAARMRGLSARDARAASLALAEELDYGPWLTRRALPEGGGLSGGIRRLVGFAMAAVAPTPLLILDEPTNDVDASRRRLLWDAVRRRADAGTGVLLVTHNVIEADQVLDEVTILDRGRVVASGTPASLRGSEGTLRLELHLTPGAQAPLDTSSPTANPQDPETSAIPSLPTRPLRAVRTGRRLLVTIPAGDAVACVDWASGQRQAGVIETYTLSPSSLEDAYLALTEAPEADHKDKTSEEIAA
ncbi:ABC transporter ATP-binding protein [Actinomyces slackii]|uniref:Daunorubicin/doxorubicin resistance ATP-binding protein DrrA n=1 Tax=Actinomyces slackii TaxID=52774 RepID=A0A3S4WLN2_9ACTO|nr:ABC transporter ATP-binding protein [Actinomyces slackii]VEG75637.1 Daunorubicin/doxorubicin resistance ATP-binding protein DrrA [Actinomyces slackii]